MLASVDLLDAPRVLVHADATPDNVLVDPGSGAIHPFNDLTRFLDVAGDAGTLELLAARFWPS